jgi:hypothetical protein
MGYAPRVSKAKPPSTSPGFAATLHPSQPPGSIELPAEEATLVEFALPAAAQEKAVEPQPEPARSGRTPAVDIDLVYERRSAPLADAPWVFVEVWTQNTIYALDANLACIDVVEQGTRKSVARHPLLGARLVGGQREHDGAMELSHPFPRPGSEAVFEQVQGKKARFTQTSAVTRVVMRLRVLSVTPERLLPTWEGVSGEWPRKPSP